jgi:hypothetical protein
MQARVGIRIGRSVEAWGWARDAVRSHQHWSAGVVDPALDGCRGLDCAPAPLLEPAAFAIAHAARSGLCLVAEFSVFADSASTNPALAAPELGLALAQERVAPFGEIGGGEEHPLVGLLLLKLLIQSFGEHLLGEADGPWRFTR